MFLNLIFFFQINWTYYSDALANPGTVMIKSLDTVVAYGTMRSTRWAIKQACITELDFHCVTINNYIFCSR